MMSVDRYLGVDLNSAGLPANGADVQRSAHTIITFTADKIRDTCEYDPNDPNDGPCDYKTGEVSGTELEDVFDYLVQPAYVEQTNDPLKRWWAQRMGFGRVNAYRAVAHSIPLKGAQTWTTSTTFFSGVSIPPENEDGIEMLMLGSYNSAGNPVLESGGEDLPGENYNNQGVTYINGTETTLTVPVNSLVAIDGLLKTTNATGNNKIITTTGTGEDISSKVLINGLLEDVEVVGNVHIGDLIIRGSSGDATGCIAIGSTANHVDLYGDVTLIDYGVLMLNRGSATFNVGSTLNLAGERDLKLKEGVSVTMDQASKITTSNGKRVIVESGSTLTVAGDIHAMIATDVIVKSGGSLIVEEDGVLAVNRFEVERDGEVILKQGARLELLSAERSIVYGRFDAQGTSGKPIRITGRLRGCATEYCELVDQAAMIEVIDDVVDLEDVSSCYLRLEHVIVKDVPFSMINVPVYPIQNCTFTGKASHFNDANVSKAFIRYATTVEELKQIRYNGETGATPLRLATDDCSFYQYEFGGTNSQEETGEVLSRELSGIVVGGISDVSVEQCDFYSLQYGVQIGGVIHSSTLSSDFTKVEYGISTLDNSGSICQSNFTSVEAPISLAGTGTFSVTDNVIDDASVGVRTIQGGLKYFRNNEFFSYARFGVFIEDCIGRFDPVPSNIISNDYDIWGRNHFEFDPTSSSFTYDANPSDVRIESTGEASFECGQNEFSEKSTYHLSANPAKGTYDISNNEFNNPAPTSHLVRTFQVTTAGTPINTSARLSGCGNVGDDACKGTITGPCWVCPLHHAYFPDETWFGLPPSSTVFDDAFDGSRSEMNTDSISDDLRILKAHHAYQAALYGDSIVDKLSMLSGDLYAIFSDPLESGNLRSAIGLLTASSYTRLGNDTFALAILDTVRYGFGEWTDSIVASWRISTLSAEIDTTISSPYRDSLWHYYGQQAIMDWRIIVGILGGYPKIQEQHDIANEHAASSVEYSGDYVRAQASPGGLAIHTQVYPGAWFSVSVYRADGERVRQLFSGPSSHERMEFSMSSEELSRGLYFVVLEAGGIAHSCPVFIE